MNLLKRLRLGLVVALLTTGAVVDAAAQTTLRVFAGGAGQRPDLTRLLAADYMQRNPGLRVEIETGGATSDLQRQYLSTVLNAKDPSIDVYLMDVVNPAQYHGAEWLEPLNRWIGEPRTALAPYLPAYALSNVVEGELAAMPAWADAMFLYYRRDLLEKHRQPLPRTWDELAAVARAVQAAERAQGAPVPQGLSLQGAPIEGTVCTFLLPYWGQGKAFNDARGKLSLDREAAARGLQLWLGMMDSGVIKRNIAEVRTPDTTNEFKAGQVLFAISWSFGWDRFNNDADSKVRGNVGVMPLPAMAGGRAATCLGGWQWAVSAFSRHKAEAAKLVRFLASAEASRLYAVRGALLPSHSALYTDAAVLQALPWLAQARDALAMAQSRPLSPDYPQVSDTIRTATSAVLARTKSPERAAAEIGSRLARVMR
jgi:multiple sugar transport system substrate-binding protein